MKKFLKFVDFTAPYIGAIVGFYSGFSLTWLSWYDLYSTVILTVLISFGGAMLGAGISDVAYRWLTELEG